MLESLKTSFLEPEQGRSHASLGTAAMSLQLHCMAPLREMEVRVLHFYGP